MVNKAILIGNLGADPESRSTNSGSTVTNLRLATTHRSKNAAGEWEEQTEWHRVVCFGRTAENVARFCSKGSRVYVEGRIQTQKWQNKDGADRWTTEIVAFVVNFLTPKSGGSGGSADSSDDIPF